MLCECAVRVQMRSSTGVSYFSDILKAALAMSRASDESEGSSMGSLAAIA